MKHQTLLKSFLLLTLIIAFSSVAYASEVIGQYQDVVSFFFLKKNLGEKRFWLRSNLANIWSEFFDSAIFMFIAYLGILPVKTIFMIIIPWWAYKIFMGFLYTPLSYLGISLLKEKNTHENYSN